MEVSRSPWYHNPALAREVSLTERVIHRVPWARSTLIAVGVRLRVIRARDNMGYSQASMHNHRVLAGAPRGVPTIHASWVMIATIPQGRPACRGQPSSGGPHLGPSCSHQATSSERRKFPLTRGSSLAPSFAPSFALRVPMNHPQKFGMIYNSAAALQMTLTLCLTEVSPRTYVSSNNTFIRWQLPSGQNLEVAHLATRALYGIRTRSCHESSSTIGLG